MTPRVRKAPVRCVMLVWLALAACQQTGADIRSRDPAEEIVAAFLAPSGIPDKAAAYTGEMLESYRNERTLGERIGKAVVAKIRPLEGFGAGKAFGIELQDGSRAVDWYAFVVEDQGRWKLAAVRTLALTGIPAALLDALDGKPDLTPEEAWQRENLRLLFESDAQLASYVRSNLEGLAAVARQMLAGEVEAARTAAHELFIDSVERTHDGRVELVVGGLVDNAVGFTYVPDGSSPPPLDPQEYIFVERVAPGWYLFKTT